MPEPTVYDKVQYHYSDEYPGDVSDEQAFVHTGFYLGWIIEQRLTSPHFEAESGDLLRKFMARELTGPDVYACWDGELSSAMLNDEGNAFSRDYFDFETGEYLADYHERLALDLPSFYHVEDRWENYVRLKERLDDRLAAWRQRKRAAPPAAPARGAALPSPERAEPTPRRKKSRWWPFR